MAQREALTLNRDHHAVRLGPEVPSRSLESIIPTLCCGLGTVAEETPQVCPVTLLSLGYGGSPLSRGFLESSVGGNFPLYWVTTYALWADEIKHSPSFMWGLPHAPEPREQGGDKGRIKGHLVPLPTKKKSKGSKGKGHGAWVYRAPPFILSFLPLPLWGLS